MTHIPEDGFVLHWGFVTLVVISIVTAGTVLLMFGWRWLWIAPAVIGSLMLLTFVVTLFEDRWRTVTDADVARGASRSCRNCDHGLDILRKTQKFKLRCPICGHREAGIFHE